LSRQHYLWSFEKAHEPKNLDKLADVILASPPIGDEEEEEDEPESPKAASAAASSASSAKKKKAPKSPSKVKKPTKASGKLGVVTPSKGKKEAAKGARK
jgi:hypothetical protein